MKAPRRSRSALLALGLAGLLAAPVSAQTSYLAISETTGGGKGEVAIYKQDNTTGAIIGTGPVATITAAGSLAAPSGLAVLTNGGGAATDLFIAGLGTGQIFDYHVATSTVSLFADLNGGPYGYPFGMTVSGGSLFVSAFGSGSTPNGAVLRYDNLASPAAAPSAVYQGNGLVNPTGLAVNPVNNTVYVNSSQNNQVFSLATTTPSPVTVSGLPLSAPAGLVFQNASGFAYEANFFTAHGSTAPAGVAEYQVVGSIFVAFASNNSGYNNATLGGPAGLVFGPQSGQLFASDYGDGLIYQYFAAPGLITNPTTYLNLGSNSTPTYLAEFTTSATLHSADATVPEPASLVLLGLGATVGLIARRRLRRA